MYGKTLISGKVIEYRGHYVLVDEGERTSTYDLRYYRLIGDDEPVTVMPEASMIPSVATTLTPAMPFSG